MDALPDELLLHIISLLEPSEIVPLQIVSRRLLSLARDNNLWKEKCFTRSKLESRRRREEQLATQGASLSALRQAMSTLPDHAALHAYIEQDRLRFDNASDTARKRARASWDPTFPTEKQDFYREYIHRQAEISVDWIHDALEGKPKSSVVLEATGVAVIPGDPKVIAPLDDGSVCIWDIHPTECKGRTFIRSGPGLLPTGHNRQPSTLEIAAVETVSVNEVLRRAYIATSSQLSEIDLQTLQIIGRSQFREPITAISESRGSTPMTIGTATTLHQFDFRERRLPTPLDISLSCELIAGAPQKEHTSRYRSNPHTRSSVSLPQPGPMSILHLQDNDIWVVGRFTSLLNYDRRSWPRVRGSTFSGARLSSLCALPFPTVAREYDLTRNPHKVIADLKAAKAQTGHTIIGAGEYKGRGSLELYGLSKSNVDANSDAEDAPLKPQPLSPSYQNRQTSARSRLLSVRPHGASLVFSDGDGNLKWTERDGSTEVRTFKINPETALNADFATEQGNLFRAQENQGDIVQKIVNVENTPNIDDLLIWTGEGRIGLVEFGRRRRRHAEDLQAEAEAALEMSEAREERLYGLGMRRALEVQADETRFMRGLGMRMGFG